MNADEPDKIWLALNWLATADTLHRFIRSSARCA
jgi:hypothetical protein